MFPDGTVHINDFNLPPLLPSEGRRTLQSNGPASEGDVASVVRRALRAQVVVHAPTLAGARDILCRSSANNTIATCAAVAGVQKQCHPLCELALTEAVRGAAAERIWLRRRFVRGLARPAGKALREARHL
jgi:hypothetical protein